MKRLSFYTTTMTVMYMLFNEPSVVLGLIPVLLQFPFSAIKPCRLKQTLRITSSPSSSSSSTTAHSFRRQQHIITATSSDNNDVDSITSNTELTSGILTKMRNKLDREFINVALPAFVGLAADPLAAIVDAVYVGRCGAVETAGMGIAISAQYSIAKLYNDPLLKTSTSIVANKSGEDLSASVSTAIVTAIIIGILQSLGFVLFGGQILGLMGVSQYAEMRKPALKFLYWRSLGIPAFTVLLVTNGIFRGRGDTKTPLYCTTFGNLVNILLDPILIIGCNMGAAGAGAATAISHYAAAIPLLYLLNKSIPFKFSQQTGFLRQAVQSYATAGSLIMLRTVAKIAAYTVTSSAAARLGTIPMAAYSLTFNLGFATSQLCESISIAAQALIARDIPLDSPKKRAATAHIIIRGLQLGVLVSGALAFATVYNQNGWLKGMTASPEVRAAAGAIMPMVLVTQIFKGLSYSTGGILLGGMDWAPSTMGMVIAAVCAISFVLLTPLTLWNIWVGLAIFMGMQVLTAGVRLLSGKGPWEGLNLLSFNPNRFLNETPLPKGLVGNEGSSSNSRGSKEENNSTQTPQLTT